MASSSYSDLDVDRRRSQPTELSPCRCEVTNTSDREAAEVVQLYLHQRYGSASRPVRELKGFQRVTLPAHTSLRVQFTIGPDQRRYWSTAARNWVLAAPTFDIWDRRQLDRRAHHNFRNHRFSPVRVGIAESHDSVLRAR